MEILQGKCVICTESTLVLSGKDKQKFVELLKENFFDANHVNHNKFLLQFKEKRTEKSICISCAYIIECYVTVRSKFQEQKPILDKKCSICRKGSNLTKGTKELINDAITLLKSNVKRVPRLSLFCLDCSFTIISWQKMSDIISNYSKRGNHNRTGVNGVHKRRHSVEDLTNSEDETDKSSVVIASPVRRSRRQSINVIIPKNTPNKKKSPYVSKYKKVKLEKNSYTEIGEKLKHLSTVSAELTCNDIYLTDKLASQIMSDDRMMFDIAYISCEANRLKQYEEKSKFQNDSCDNDEQLPKNLSASTPRKSGKIKRTLSTSKSSRNEVSDNDNDEQLSKNLSSATPRKSGKIKRKLSTSKSSGNEESDNDNDEQLSKNLSSTTPGKSGKIKRKLSTSKSSGNEESDNDNDEQLSKNLSSATPRKSDRIKKKLSTSKSSGNKVSNKDKKKKKFKTDTSNDNGNELDSSSQSSDVVVISDTECDSPNSPVRKSSRKTKGQRKIDVPQKKTGQHTINTPPKIPRTRRLAQKIQIGENGNKCASCPKQYVKKYRLQLHELEHEASFRPVVVVQKDKTDNELDLKTAEESIQETNAETEEKQDENETQEQVETLVKQVVNDTLSLLENEIGENIVKQVVDDTLSQICEDTEKLSEQNNDLESIGKEKEIAGNDESGANKNEEENETCNTNNETERNESNETSTNKENSEIEKINGESTNDNDEIHKNMNEDVISQDAKKLAEQNDENHDKNSNEAESEHIEKSKETLSENADTVVIINESPKDWDKQDSDEENGDCSPVEIIETDPLNEGNSNENNCNNTITDLEQTEDNTLISSDKSKDKGAESSEDTNEIIDTTKSFVLEEDKKETNDKEPSNNDELTDPLGNLATENGSEVSNTSSTDKNSKILEDEESDMESLKISGGSSDNSPIKKTAELTIDADKYDTVENLLENLGA